MEKKTSLKSRFKRKEAKGGKHSVLGERKTLREFMRGRNEKRRTLHPRSALPSDAS